MLGVAALVDGIVMTGVAASASGDDAANAALGVVMLFMLAVDLLGPLIARLCAWLIGLPLRAGPAPAHPASANSRANARRLASAITRSCWPWPSPRPWSSCTPARTTRAPASGGRASSPTR
ncbi:hypothetical protein [Streptomyces malaysiensis]|uniref:hypothetical protein n=1 Tax=Streptomyces malaysiensis TaxID=92644 RepID=UPI001651A7FE|nr:hypothetical protein [Streptomyces malaysiensis]